MKLVSHRFVRCDCGETLLTGLIFPDGAVRFRDDENAYGVLDDMRIQKPHDCVETKRNIRAVYTFGSKHFAMGLFLETDGTYDRTPFYHTVYGMVSGTTYSVMFHGTCYDFTIDDETVSYCIFDGHIGRQITIGFGSDNTSIDLDVLQEILNRFASDHNQN